MRKNVKQQLALRVLSTAALMAMVSSIATAAFAAEYNVKDGSVEIVAKDGIQSITQRDDTGAFVKDEKGDIDHRQDDDIILTTKNKDTGETETTSNTVTITAEDGNTANVTLQDVHIETEGSWNNTGSAPIEIKGNGDTKLELNGDNTVLSGDSHHAAIEKADVNGTGTLTIKDDKNDDGSVKKRTKTEMPLARTLASWWQAATIMVPVSAAAHITMKKKRIMPILPTLPSPVVRSLPAAVITAPVSAPVAMEMHQISALRAMHMLPPFQTAVLPLDPVIMRQATVILPSPIMPLWRLLA